MIFFLFIFLIFALNIDCGYNEAILRVPTTYDYSKNKKKMYTLVKVGCKGCSLHGHQCYHDTLFSVIHLRQFANETAIFAENDFYLT